jgi:hypothetical protein
VAVPAATAAPAPPAAFPPPPSTTAEAEAETETEAEAATMVAAKCTASSHIDSSRVPAGWAAYGSIDAGEGVLFDGSPPDGDDDTAHEHNQHYDEDLDHHNDFDRDGRGAYAHDTEYRTISRVPTPTQVDNRRMPSLYGFVKSLLPTVFGDVERAAQIDGNEDDDDGDDTCSGGHGDVGGGGGSGGNCDTLSPRPVSEMDTPRNRRQGEAHRGMDTFSQEFDGSPPDSPRNADDFPSSDDEDVPSTTTVLTSWSSRARDGNAGTELHIGGALCMGGSKTSAQGTAHSPSPSSPAVPTVFCPCCQMPLTSLSDAAISAASADAHVEDCVTGFVEPAMPCPAGLACVSTTARHFR